MSFDRYLLGQARETTQMADHIAIHLTVNAREATLTIDPDTPLILALRNELGLKGARPGCAIGECGVCTVIVDGEPVRSCVTTLESVAGCHVTTPEGLGTPDAPHPVQTAFLEEQAAQCGYCINGIIMTVAAFRDTGPEAEERIRAALPEHLCRCGTHVRVLRAIRRALGDADEQPGSVPAQQVGSCGTVCQSVRIPPALAGASEVQSWLGLLDDGRIEARSGRMELGQGLRTALAQIVATQLGVSADRVMVRSPATDATPDEQYTAGSRSIEEGGTALAMAAVAFRRLVLGRASAHLGQSAEALVVDDRGVGVRDGDARLSWPELAAGEPVTGEIEPDDRPHWHGGSFGQAVARDDLISKITGAPAYVHDLQLPGMVHARALLPPGYEARLEGLDVDSARAIPGVRAVVHSHRLVIAVTDREEQARNVVAKLRETARWQDPGLDVPGDLATMLRSLPAETLPARQDPDVDHALSAGIRRLRSTYVRPYQAHAAMAPSCAVAVDDGTTLTVWTHSQGVYPLRRELAAMLGVDEATLSVRHVDGPGCYGHNGADDAAAFAALAARSVPGIPVRFQFSVEDEFTWEPYGSAMLADLEASLDARGCITGWRHRSRTDVHASRPHGTGDRLMPSWLVTEGRSRPWTGPRATGAGDVVPIYDLPAVEAATDFVRGPLRTSALRSLASFHNIFATESFIDELAEAAGRDPVDFRLAHLGDERARAVLEAAAGAAGWTRRMGPSGWGRGIAVSRYKGSKAYVSAVVDATVDQKTGEVVVERVILACDAGVVVNPDGLRNQLEGGALQGLSRALYEEVRADRGGILSRNWTTYPVLRFGQVPDVEVLLIDRPDAPPLGVGESATPPVAAAVANAISDAIGGRLRTLPLTPQRIRDRMSDPGDDEAARLPRPSAVPGRRCT